MSKNTDRGKQVLKLVVIGACLGGFLFQTFEFLDLYWTYPTVVDIQVSVPSEIEMPGITFCNPNGIKPDGVCKFGKICTNKAMLSFVGSKLCLAFPAACVDNKLPPDFTGVAFNYFFSDHDINATIMEAVRIPVQKFFDCKIVSSGIKTNCSMENVIIASYFSDTYTPNFCYTINSLWGDPKRKIQKIKKTDTIELEFYIDIVNRPNTQDIPDDEVQRPKYNVPGSSSAQLAIHSPYLTASPFAEGYSFLGGKKYRVRVRKDEKHLLPPPYQTNCTDYVPLWQERGGYGPLNQMMVIEECRYNQSLEELGCVPFTVDYPHNDSLCRYCAACLNQTRIGENCTDLLRTFNQPCENIKYTMKIEEKIVYNRVVLQSSFLRRSVELLLRQQGYNCTHEKMFTRRCQTIWIEIAFDGFDVTNMTYNAKFESMELFSVIGGYMGMYLGVSIVAVYDFAEIMITGFYTFWRKHSKNKKNSKRQIQKKFQTKVSQFDNDFRRMESLRGRNVHKMY